MCLDGNSEVTAPCNIQSRIDSFGGQLLAHVARIRAAEPPGNLLRRTPRHQMPLDISPQPRACQFPQSPGLTGPGGSPVSEPHTRDRGVRVWRCGSTRGLRCSGLVPRSGPLLGSNDRGPVPDSQSHVLQHSDVDTISCAWQHRNPFGYAVLHLELELKV